MSKVLLNGKFVDKSQATISVLDNGLLYGDGVFEGIRVYRGKAFKLDAHLQRLYESARSLHLPIPIDLPEMRADVIRAVKANGLEEGYVRLIVTRGGGISPGFEPISACAPSIVIIAEQIALYPESVYRKGLRIIVANTIRNLDGALSPRIKSLNYLNNILAKVEAAHVGSQEAIMLNSRSEVAECTADNVFAFIDDTLVTPPKNAGILDGITRNIILELAPLNNLALVERPLMLDDLYGATECFITGTAAEIVPVTHINDHPIGNGQPGPRTLMLERAFRHYVEQEQTA
jgi:branched-chain amino acid aminotransferase